MFEMFENETCAAKLQFQAKTGIIFQGRYSLLHCSET